MDKEPADETTNYGNDEPKNTSSMPETSVDPVEQMERMADIAESDAKEIQHLKKVAENDHPGLVVPAEQEPQSDQLVDVRQDFIEQMHQPKSRSKVGTGKKAAIAILVVIVVGVAGFFIWWFAYYSQPNVVLADALKKLVTADSVNTGAILETTTEGLDGELMTREILLTSEFHGLTESSHFLAVNGANTSEDIENTEDEENDGGTSEATGLGLTAEIRMLSSGTLYAKLSNLDALAVEYDDTEASISEITEEIDGKWYQINAEDVLQFLGIGQAEMQPIIDFYHCSMSVAGQDYSKDLIALYQDYPFLSIEKSENEAFTSGATAYDLSINYEELANFLNALPNLGAMESIYVCYNTMAESLDIDEISAEDLAEVSAEELEEIFPADNLLQLEISNFGHELVRFSTNKSDGGIQQNFSIDFSYNYQEIAAPDEYWSAEDLVTVLQDYTSIFLEQMSTVDSAGESIDDSQDESENEWYDDDGWYLGEDLYEEGEE